MGELCKPKISESTIRKYELNILNPKVETIQKIADALEVFLGDIKESDNFLSTKKFEEYYDSIKNLPTKEKETALINFMDSYAEKELVYDIDENNPSYIQLINEYMQKLNDVGQKKAVERVEELTEISRYTKPVDPPQD